MADKERKYSDAQKAMRIDGVIFALTGAASALRHGRGNTADWKIDAAIMCLRALKDSRHKCAQCQKGTING